LLIVGLTTHVILFGFLSNSGQKGADSEDLFRGRVAAVELVLYL